MADILAWDMRAIVKKMKKVDEQRGGKGRKGERKMILMLV